jgi:hypothetical protein
MAYIEENIKRRRGGNAQDGLTTTEKPYDPQEELFRIEDKYKLQKKPLEEGNVTNSMAMLTAIPEVDLGMEYVRFNEGLSHFRTSHVIVLCNTTVFG